MLRNILPFCNLIGSARIPAETKGQPKKVNVSNQTPFSEGGAVGVVWGRDYFSIAVGRYLSVHVRR